MSNEAVCRTAPATPGLSKMLHVHFEFPTLSKYYTTVWKAIKKD